MSWPQPTRGDHERCCRIEQWNRVRDARGRSGTHHVTYELGLPDGRVLRTRISHPVDHSEATASEHRRPRSGRGAEQARSRTIERSDYGSSMWEHLLRDQLQVDEATFWACVRDGIKPDRGMPTRPTQALPAELVHLLISRVGLDERDVAAMSKEDAIARLQRFWTEGD